MKLHLLAIGLLPVMIAACSSENSLTDGSNSSGLETAKSTVVSAPPVAKREAQINTPKRW